MSFFKSLFKGRQDPLPASEEADASQTPKAQLPPELFSGMKAEVLTPENHLLFVGKLTILEDNSLEVRSESDSALPQTLYKQVVKLRCFQKNSQTLTLQGKVFHSGLHFWHLEELEALQKNQENRNFFRQSAQISATLLPSERCREEAIHRCTILDISAGGARLVSSQKYSEGAMLFLRAVLLTEEEPFSINCQVRRVAPRGSSDWEYGCQFVGLSEKEQNRLLQAVFVLQRRALQAKRD